MAFIFPYIGNVIIPTDDLIFFRGVETTNQIYVLVSFCHLFQMAGCFLEPVPNHIWSQFSLDVLFSANPLQATLKSVHRCSATFGLLVNYYYPTFVGKTW